MISLQIEDIKLFMHQLLKDTTFDDFEVVSLELSHNVNVTIEGRLNHDYYSPEEQETLKDQAYIKWNDLRPTILPLLRGSKLPASLKIILSMSEKARLNIIEKSGTNFSPEAVNGFLMNIQYSNKTLKIITGTNYKQFIPDKSLEHYFDDTIRRFFSKHDIAATVLKD